MIPDATNLPANLGATAERTAEYIRASRAANTERAYRSDWQDFTAWCDGHGLASLPAAESTVALYLTDLAATHKPGTLQRRVSAISQAHQAAKLPVPTKGAVAKTMAGIRRTCGTAQRGKTAARTQEIRAMVATCDEGPLGTRDRAAPAGLRGRLPPQ